MSHARNNPDRFKFLRPNHKARRDEEVAEFERFIRGTRTAPAATDHWCEPELDDDRPCLCGRAHTAAEHNYDPDKED